MIDDDFGFSLVSRWGIYTREVTATERWEGLVQHRKVYLFRGIDGDFGVGIGTGTVSHSFFSTYTEALFYADDMAALMGGWRQD